MEFSLGSVAKLWSIAGGAIYQAIGFLRHSKQDRLAVARGHQQCLKDRDTFWNCLREGYATFRQHEHATLPPDVRRLIDAAGPPPNDCARLGIEPVLPAFSESQLAFWSFCEQLFPTGGNSQLAEHGNTMRVARGQLAHFWENSVEATSHAYLARKYESAYPEVTALAWMEFALAQQAGSGLPDKTNLLRLASHFSAAV